MAQERFPCTYRHHTPFGFSISQTDIVLQHIVHEPHSRCGKAGAADWAGTAEAVPSGDM